MPTIEVPPGYGEAIVNMSATGDADAWAMTFGVWVATTPGAATVAAGIDALFNTRLAGVLGSAATLGPVTVRYRRSDQTLADPLLVEVAGTVHAGTGGATYANPLPQNCALLVHKRTATGGRRGRGRIYMPWVNEQNVDANGVIATTQLATYQTAWSGILTDLNALDTGTAGDFGDTFAHMFVLHSPKGGVSGGPPSQVTALQCDSTIATQRRRLRK